MDKMDKYFGSVASLMSNLLRVCVENSLADFLTFMEEYLDGNNYEGTYEIFKGLALPTKILPITIYLVNIFQILYQYMHAKHLQ